MRRWWVLSLRAKTCSGSGMWTIIFGDVVVKRRHRCNAHFAMNNFFSTGGLFFSYVVRFLLTNATTRFPPSPRFYVIIASPVSSPTDTNRSIGLYGSAILRSRRCSIVLSILFRASVHSSVHSPAPLGERRASIGRIFYLKLGTNGEAHNSFPSICCNSCSEEGIEVPIHLFRLFFASL